MPILKSVHCSIAPQTPCSAASDNHLLSAAAISALRGLLYLDFGGTRLYIDSRAAAVDLGHQSVLILSLWDGRHG
jgi:hypothetical protein